MQIEIQPKQFPLTETLRSYTENRLQMALSSCYEDIDWVVLNLSEISSSSSTYDRRCQVRLFIKGMPEVVAEDTEPYIHTAINRSIDRAARTVLRRMKMQHFEFRRVRTSTAKLITNDASLKGIYSE